MRLRHCLLATCITLSSVQLHAETISNLYQVREPVASQTPEERTQATQRALETLVLRLTGDAKAIANPGLASVRQDPQQIISQYGYDAGPPESLQVDFDIASTDNALRSAGLPTWGSNRPSILGWWLSDSVEGSSLVGDGQSAAEPLRRAAQHRGLPLRLPLADLGEQGVGTAQNIEASDPAALRSASERYGADALLAVHAREEEGKWSGTWRLWLGNQREQGKAEGADQAALADAVLLAVSQRLAPRFVAKPGASTEMTLAVEGMNLERYAQMGRLLESYGARVRTVDGDKVVYRVTGSAEQLRAQLGLAKLQEVPYQAPVVPVDAQAVPGAPAPAPAAQPAPDLNFRW
ncbi:DUF2066 domain-containing protein [Pseudomonas coleopterorum]|uniref:DUF2066 domain-containing protein n=1 Tax=Pseudomonas coleopterorum TaxID=1605838 RepID=UPI002A6A6A58|nr:DUF2066 domain-containing protein [Pseudomonas coleopterorum]MDY1016586.1 DUF2066 domain-containing protein [Pseudomonas coleopterorum]